MATINYFSKNNFSYFWTKLKALLNLKYDKTGGEITGTVKVDGNLVLDIDDPDYDSGITMTKTLDTNAGTILTLTGYANANGENTSYKPVIRNVATPVQNYDVANKKYVDDNQNVPTLHLVELNLDGSVKTQSSTLVYSTIQANMTDPKKSDYLDIIWETGQNTNQFQRFQAHVVGISEVNNGDIMFEAEIFHLGMPMWIVFTLNRYSQLTTIAIISRESVANKVNDIVANSTSTIYYPTTKAVFDQFQRKPVVVWEASEGSELNALGADLNNSISWQLTGLDMTPYSYIKIYSKAGKGRTDASTTPAIVLEMTLDTRASSSAWGGNYCASAVVQKPNDSNRFATLTCAVSADKTKFAVLRQTSLYGTAATTNADIGAGVYKIVGYYN